MIRRLLLGLMLCAMAAGCRGNVETAPGAPATPAAPVNAGPASPATPDEKVLAVLDCYEPMYKVNADGRVIRLRLNGRYLPVAVMAEVGKLTELEALDLYGAIISDDGLGELKNLQKLRNLGLGGSGITDKGLVHLEKLQSLQWTWVPKNSVSKAAIEKLKETRPDLTVYPQ